MAGGVGLSRPRPARRTAPRCAATVSQENSVTARSRPARPIASARPGSRSSMLSASDSDAGSSGGTSSPVTPPLTTSGMPPTRDATTAVSQAIASRLTMPSGSYTDGQANTSACVSSWMTSFLGSISGIQITPDRDACSSATSEDTSAPSSGRVRRAGAEHELRRRVERRGRPQQHRHALLPGDPPDEDDIRPERSMPCRSSTSVPGSGAYSAVSMPLRITRTRSGEISG